LSKISEIECREKLHDLRIIRMVNMTVKIASDEKS